MTPSTNNVCQAPSLPTSRKEARAIGAVHYFTGKPCPQGHICNRYACDGKCVKCSRERSKKYMETYRRPYYERNIEKFKDASRTSYLKHKERHKERGRLWRKSNPERARAITAEWQDKNRDRIRSLWRKWQKMHPDKVAANARNRRARKRNAEGSHSASDIAAILKLQRNRCAHCRGKLRGRDYHVDHIISLKKGGSNWPKNLQILCPACNMLKKDRDPVDHARLLGLLL